MPYKSLAPVKMDVETEKAAGGYANSSQKATLPRLSRYQTFLFSITCAIAVANIYFAQPLLESMAASLAVSSGIIGIVVTATQAGYAVGLLFIVPLGDLLNRKKIILTQMLLSALALCAVGMAQNWIMLLGAMVLVGLMAVVVQVVVAYAATLASPEQRGEAVGTVTSGIVLGILLARFVSGAVADLAGWRGVYFVSAVLMVCMALVLFRTMPASTPPPAKDGYWKLLRSMFQLYLTERSLRVRGTFALLIFAAFSVLWTSMVLPLSAPPLSLSHTQIGLFGLAGVWCTCSSKSRATCRQRVWQSHHRRGAGTTDFILAAHRVCRKLVAGNGSWSGFAGLCRAGGPCHQSKPDFCLATRRAEPSRWRIYVLLLDRQRSGRGGGYLYLRALWLGSGVCIGGRHQCNCHGVLDLPGTHTPLND